MKDWQIRLERLLATHDAPPVLTRDLLARFARSARAGESLPERSLSHWLGGTLARDRLALLQRGLYLNRFRAIPPSAADATPFLRADAIVSLNTVLGDAGVLNNPSRIITAVVPIDRDAPPPKLGKQKTAVADFRFHGLPRRILEAGEADERLDQSGRYEHPRATSEKALIDWLYLAHSPRSTRTLPPRGDIDLDLLDTARLSRLAEVSGLRSELRSWLAR